MSRINQLLELLEDDEENAFLYFAIAKEYEKGNDLAKAEELYSTVIDRFPNYHGVYYHLGKLYESLEQKDKALEIYSKGIGICTELKEHHALSELMGAKTNCELDI